MDYKILYIFLLVSFMEFVSPVRIPPNPCPDTFSYYKDANGMIYGEANIPYDRATVMTFSVNASLPTKLVKDGNLLELKLETSVKQLTNNISTVTYHIAYLYQTVIPRITQITYNGQVFCRGPREPFISGIQDSITNVWYSTNFRFTRIPEGYLYEDGEDPGIPESEIPVKSPNTSGIHYGNDHLPTPKIDVRHSVPTSAPGTSEYPCGVPKYSKITPLLWGAADTEVGQFPWLVAIMYDDEYKCSATLISDKHVITTSICVQAFPEIEKMLLVMGTNDAQDWKSNDAVTREVLKVHSHGDYLKDPDNSDAVISVITMVRPVRFSDLLIPVCLWKGNTDVDLITNNKGTVVGYGQDEAANENGDDYVSRAKYTEMNIVSQVECLRSENNELIRSARRTFCAGGDGKGPCIGDGGSGLVLHKDGVYQLRGITSFAIAGTCDNKEYTIFCDVAKFTKWVKSCMANINCVE